MMFRLATLDDLSAMAALHRDVGHEGGFMATLGVRFLRAYYRNLVLGPCGVVLCAKSEEGQLLGFVAGSLDAAAQEDQVRSARVRLAIAALPDVVRNPRAFTGALQRYRSLKRNAEVAKYYLGKGARAEYWAWNPTSDSSGSLILFRRWIKLMRLLGAEAIHFEVDEGNLRVVKIHHAFGAKTTAVMTTPSGQRRFLLEYPFPETVTHRGR